MTKKCKYEKTPFTHTQTLLRLQYFESNKHDLSPAFKKYVDLNAAAARVQ